MPAPEYRHRYQPAVLWPTVGYDAYGQPALGSPVEIRTQGGSDQMRVLDPLGNTVTLDATLIVDRDIAIGSRIWMGELADWYGTGSGMIDQEVMEVKTFNSTPDIRNRATFREIGLMRLHRTV